MTNDGFVSIGIKLVTVAQVPSLPTYMYHDHSLRLDVQSSGQGLVSQHVQSPVRPVRVSRVSRHLTDTRIALNYKKIPFETEWLEYPDIELVLKSIDAKPTSKYKDADGSSHDKYTVPVIRDTATGTVMSDSLDYTVDADFLSVLRPGEGSEHPGDGLHPQ